MAGTKNSKDWIGFLNESKALKDYRVLNWEGSFAEYLDLVKEDPQVARNAFQRTYDMILSWGTDVYKEYKKNIVHYKFFEDPIDGGKDGVYGLDIPLMKLVNFLKSAALGYGTEKRVLL